MGAKFGKTLVMNRCVKYFIWIYKLSKSSFNNGWRSTSEDSRNKIKELFNCTARCSLIRYYMYMYMLEINMQQIIESDVERDYRVSSIIKGSLTGAELLNNIEMYCHRTGAKFGKTLVMNRCVKYFISINKLSKSSLIIFRESSEVLLHPLLKEVLLNLFIEIKYFTQRFMSEVLPNLAPVL